ncbi:MAG: hypothetical protein NC310_01660 [Roseburia sp.]|nr:hypothetical protein [Anaeroplasma bactoclasticum]MCM1195760.1 hypothetical protein [Roseburia sp.]
MTFSNDLILFLSGVPCVGKTSAAYNLIRTNSYFQSVTELDVFIEAMKEIIKGEKYSDEISKHYNIIFDSPALMDYPSLKQHARTLIDFILAIVKRQKARKIPTIIEGTGIVPSVYFEKSQPLKELAENVVFINLYISDEKEHIHRRVNRCKTRNYKESLQEIKSQIKNTRNKNQKLHEETVELSKRFSNVYSIDVAKLNEQEVVHKINEKLIQCFKD